MKQRTIKFRAQDIASNKWLYGDLRHHKDDVCIFEHGGTKGEQVKNDTIGQFTGIKDALDRDIYEGDIVKIDGCPEKGNLIVVFYEGSFALATPKEYLCLQQGVHPYLNDYARLTELGIFDFQGLYKVIGNVTDDPELYKLRVNYGR